MNVIAENTSVSATKASYATVAEWKLRRKKFVANVWVIQLVVPVAHIWYFRSLPNKIGYLLEFLLKKLDSIIYYEKYVVIQAGT